MTKSAALTVSIQTTDRRLLPLTSTLARESRKYFKIFRLPIENSQVDIVIIVLVQFGADTEMYTNVYY